MSAAKTTKQKSYFSLAKHNVFQIFIFYFLLFASIVLIFVQLLPLLSYFFTNFLGGEIVNNGKWVPYYIDSAKPLRETSTYLTWAVDIYKNTAQEARYWFNPILSVCVPSSILGIFLAFIISMLLPRRLGYMRHKVEREIANTIEKITSTKLGYIDEHEKVEIINSIISADLRDLHGFVKDWGINIEDLKVFRRVLIWRQGSILFRIWHLNDAVRFYMRSYFTVKYNNTVLGFVYVGAAILIIIIGLRGLKFVPPTQPSLVLFALGLEFSLLVTYAFTLMYTKQEDEAEADKHLANHQNDNLYMGSEFGNSREIEKLLRIFIKSGSKKSKE